MKEIIIDGVTYSLTPKEEVLVFGKYKIGSCVVSLMANNYRKVGDVFKVQEKSKENELWYNGNYSTDVTWRQATEEETSEYEKRGGTYNISELKPKFPKTWEELGTDKNTFATKEQAKASIALAQLSQLLKVYRGDWTPDWSAHDRKYCIYFNQDNVDIHFLNYSSSFLSFPTEELAQEFLDNFRDLIEKAKPLL